MIALTTILTIVKSKRAIGMRQQRSILVLVFLIMRAVHPLMSLLQYRTRRAGSAIFAILSGILLALMFAACQILVIVLVARVGEANKQRALIFALSVKAIAIELIIWDVFIMSPLLVCIAIKIPAISKRFPALRA